VSLSSNRIVVLPAAWAGLGNTCFWIDPAKGVAGVILMQLIPFADVKALAVFAGFETAVYAALS